MSEPVLWMQNGAVGVLTINRPETRNAVSDADVLDALLAALDRADGDPAVRVIVLTGAGAAFSAGGNVKAIQAGLVDRLGVAGTRDFYRHNIQRLTERFEAMDTPSIAAVNGPAMGLGCDLACMCDLRLAAPQARFAMSFVKLGLVPGDGGAMLLPRIVGFAKASEMILTGDPIDADAALGAGLISAIVPADVLIDEAVALARRIAVNAPHAVRLARRLLRRATAGAMPELLELSAAFQALAHVTDDHAEAVRAFLERRPPDFEGR